MKTKTQLSIVFMLGMVCLLVTGIVESGTIESAEDLTAERTYSRMKSTLPKHDVVCFAESKVSCSKGDCKPANRTVFVLIRHEDSSFTTAYHRCDRNGCDSYKAARATSGGFEIFTPSAGAILKMTRLNIPKEIADPGTFVEITTLGLNTLVAEGRCSPR